MFDLKLTNATLTDGRTGMDFDAGEEARQLRQNPGRPAERRLRPQSVGEPVGPDGMQTRVDDRVLHVTARRGIVRPGVGQVLTQGREQSHVAVSP